MDLWWSELALIQFDTTFQAQALYRKLEALRQHVGEQALAAHAFMEGGIIRFTATALLDQAHHMRGFQRHMLLQPVFE